MTCYYCAASRECTGAPPMCADCRKANPEREARASTLDVSAGTQVILAKAPAPGVIGWRCEGGGEWAPVSLDVGCTPPGALVDPPKPTRGICPPDCPECAKPAAERPARVALLACSKCGLMKAAGGGVMCLGCLVVAGY